MRGVCSPLTLASLLAVLGGGLCFAGYDVQVTATDDLLNVVQSIAVAPVACPPDINCVRVEQDLEEDLRAYPGFAVISASRVRQAMLELRVETLDGESYRLIGEHLKVDAFLIPVVAHSGTDSEGAVGVWTGTTVVMTDAMVAKGNVELRLVRSTDGTVLLRGSGFGESEFRGSKGVVRKVFRRILRTAFGTPPR